MPASRWCPQRMQGALAQHSKPCHNQSTKIKPA